MAVLVACLHSMHIAWPESSWEHRNLTASLADMDSSDLHTYAYAPT